ncbi:competence protein ComGF [Oikeobacillus pervagus]|uniref:Competence protein ComGF n=1 Tax=Oikeobacillus pervagus TaxID=1325931 RepID=A0AAJ1WHQ3_9BACI|nr:competence type IV pilus minor pilin ComGF [Oikeobacillus pervagus]MDQ0213855.1 competence protein ComGF [Oikeobacillus pervagus]
MKLRNQEKGKYAFGIQGMRNVFRNNNGFTFIESLLVLSIFLGVTSLFPLVYQSFYEAEHHFHPLKKTEWELFLIQLRKELHTSQSWSSHNGRLSYFNGDREIWIEKYQTSLRRRVDRKGHEIILQNVQEIHFSWHNNVLQLEVIFLNGDQEVAKFHPYTRKE